MTFGAFDRIEQLVEFVSFETNQRQVVVGAWGDSISVIDRNQTNSNRTIKIGTHAIQLAIYPDGRLVAGGKEGNVEIWNLRDQTCERLPGHSDWVTGIAVTPDGMIVSGSHDCTVKVSNPNNGSVETMAEHQHPVRCVCVLPDGHVASGAFECAKIWDPSNRLIPEDGMQQNWVTHVVARSDGMVAGCCRDQIVRVWNPSGETISQMKEHTDDVLCLTVLPDDRVVSGSKDTTVKVWDVDEGSVATMSEHQVGVACVAALLDGRIVSGSGDGRENAVKLWNPEDSTVLTMAQHRAPISTLTELANGRIASGSVDKDIYLWDPVSNSILLIDSHTGKIDGIVELADGQLATGSHGYNLYVWDVPDESVLEVECEWGCLSLGVLRLPGQVSIENANELVYFRNDLGDVLIWNPVTWDLSQIGESPIGSVGVKHVGSRIVAAAHQSVHVFDLFDSETGWIDIEMPAPVTALATDATRNRIICGTIYGVVVLEIA